jgi:hypothetical protein
VDVATKQGQVPRERPLRLLPLQVFLLLLLLPLLLQSLLVLLLLVPRVTTDSTA